MPHSPRGQLSDPRYRAAMLSKLESLIAVLEVARAKAERAVDERPQDVTRLARVRANLEKTLEVCRRAQASLIAPPVKGVVDKADPCHRQFIESMNFEEYRRLRKQPPIANGAVGEEQLEELCSKLADL